MSGPYSIFSSIYFLEEKAFCKNSVKRSSSALFGTKSLPAAKSTAKTLWRRSWYGYKFKENQTFQKLFSILKLQEMPKLWRSLLLYSTKNNICQHLYRDSYRKFRHIMAFISHEKRAHFATPCDWACLKWRKSPVPFTLTVLKFTRTKRCLNFQLALRDVSSCF